MTSTSPGASVTFLLIPNRASVIVQSMGGASAEELVGEGVAEGIGAIFQHGVGGVDDIDVAGGERHVLVDPQQGVRDRAVHGRGVGRGVVGGGDDVVNAVTNLGEGVPGLVDVDGGGEQVHRVVVGVRDVNAAEIGQRV